MSRHPVFLSVLFVLWLGVTGGLSYLALTERAQILDHYKAAQARMESEYQAISAKIERASARYSGALDEFLEAQSDKIKDAMDTALSVPEREPRQNTMAPGYMNASYDIALPPPALTLSELKKRQSEDEQARLYGEITPAAGVGTPLWTPEQAELDVEAVLVPRRVTVISSSHDGRIAAIPVGHGDHFKKGDLLVSYDCSNLRAEADIAKIEKSFAEKRKIGTDSLFKLDIISDLDQAGAQAEDSKAAVKSALYQDRLKDCDIRSEFDGRVTNRLANPGEYTRTDRVLLEVASDETLQVEFLVPSKWLRWINIGAPISVTISETERSYDATIERIHGEVDPVSQSIQMIASLAPYQDALLPGMSGKARINVDSIRNAGIKGYLEVGKSPESH